MAKQLFYKVYTLWEVDSMTINLFLNFIRFETLVDLVLWDAMVHQWVQLYGKR